MYTNATNGRGIIFQLALYYPEISFSQFELEEKITQTFLNFKFMCKFIEKENSILKNRERLKHQSIKRIKEGKMKTLNKAIRERLKHKRKKRLCKFSFVF
jgi:flagella basal body P-ring formation protein FlgA